VRRSLRERDIRRFLAYSTIENIGIIVTAFGAAMIFHAYRQPALWAFLLLAGLYHVANHGCYKTLLFLEAGVVEHTTGTRDMDRLGGGRRARRCPCGTGESSASNRACSIRDDLFRADPGDLRCPLPAVGVGGSCLR
jgi:hypothetical protein